MARPYVYRPFLLLGLNSRVVFNSIGMIAPFVKVSPTLLALEPHPKFVRIARNPETKHHQDMYGVLTTSASTPAKDALLTTQSLIPGRVYRMYH